MDVTPPQEQVTLPPHLSEFAQFVRGTITTTTETSNERPETLRAWLNLAETYRITQALRECNGNRSAAARLLGIGRRTLYAKMEKLGIAPSWRVS
jgi:DNA-binding NtrC family response regulator